jgi:hypothetical protein
VTILRCFYWTRHAEERLTQRQLTRGDVEQAIREHHDDRQVNTGRADWLLSTSSAAGVPFEAVYDHPVSGDATAVRIVSAWRLD